MRLDDFGQSSNVRNRRGEGGSRMGSGGAGLMFVLIRMVMSRFGIGGLVVLGIGFFALQAIGINPLSSGGGTQRASAPQTSQYDQLVGAVLLSTENVFTEVFREEGIGDYPEPVLNLFAGRVTTRGCGSATSAVGPFYCPADSQVYIDTSFFDELGQRFGAPGDFAQAYVIAHEVGHHIQNVTGISDQVRRQQASARSEADRNEYSVRLELMADCLAGVWAGRTQIQLDPGDIREALGAAAAIGDDTLQRRSGGRVVPDSFTHGTSEQRQRWFTTGYRARDISACDTLGTDQL
ncbi:neutral zinc metallopeptidase [Parvularcula sp. ZS-1/3]|uniref:Neutral zinc metallopeptidase n=1 Tax=Parvularcula mediterranea TaxID=2732508 RepID=A0A7Y3W4W3_9PROT|nr:neutral zinc metallopeptidase [Parvularcula mediterranea]NNU15621.1 neutral zinc metallopeptidase [Parvularcula mediterranea]